MASTAKEMIGNSYKMSRGGSITVGRIDYDWAFPIPHFFPIGSDTYTAYNFTYSVGHEAPFMTLNGAWGAWNGLTPGETVDLRVYAANAGTYSQVGESAGWIDDILENGEETYNANHSDTWDDFIDRLDRYGSWLWGSTREGGCCLLYDGTGYHFIGTYGVWTNQNGSEKIACSESNAYSMSQLSEGVMAVYHRSYTGESYSTEVSWVYKTSNKIALCTDPVTQTVVFIDYNLSEADSLTDTFNNGKKSFGVDHAYIAESIFSLSTVSSPYQGQTMCLSPHEITDPNYEYDWGDIDSFAIDIWANEDGDGDNDGDGDWSPDSDEVDLTDLSQFTTDAQSCGFVTVFKPDKTTLRQFAEWLYGDFPNDYSSILDTVGKLIKNPMDCIISLNMAHFDATVSGSEDMAFFGQASGLSAPIVDGLVQKLDCGYVYISEYSGSFLDYGGMSSIKIYLPYCGTFGLKTNEVMGATLHLQYLIDLLTGACVAELKVTRSRNTVTSDPDLKSVLYRFNGNIFQQVPISNVDYSNILRGQMGILSSIGTLASGNVLGAMTGATNSMLGMKPGMEHVGSCGSSYGYMSTQKPFIIQEYPWTNTPSRYENYYGRPSYSYKSLNNCDGYTEIDTDTLWADFKGITQEEEDMLKSILNSGGIYIEHNNAYTNYEP